jgi:transporter family protein
MAVFSSMWFIYAALAAIFAAMVGIFAKIAMRDINPDLATALRAIVQVAVVVIFAAGMGMFSQLRTVTGKAMGAIALAGFCGAMSWVFGFRAIKLIGVAKVAPIDKLSVPIAVALAVLLFGEKFTAINWCGVGLITVGAYLSSVKW